LRNLGGYFYWSNMKTKDYNSIKWEDHFYLDETSPSGLSRKNDFYTRPCHTLPKFPAGTPVGTRSYLKNGNAHSWNVVLNKSSYKVHRIIWILLEGHLQDDLVVDHINGNPFDNSVSNLQTKPHKSNLQNRRRNYNSKSNPVGVCFTSSVYPPTGSTYATWSAHWCNINGKNCIKSFSINKHGHETAKQMAIDHRNLQISLLNDAGASYTERHQGIPSTT